MLADVGMVKTYSKSAHVNDLGFVWTGPPPCCMDQLPPPPPPPLFAWAGPPPCYYGFSARWFCHALQVRTAPSLHLPLFLEETFLHTHKGRSLCVLGICQLVGHRLVMPLLLRPQLVMHWLVMHALAKDSPGWPGDVSVTDLPCVHALYMEDHRRQTTNSCKKLMVSV